MASPTFLGFFVGSSSLLLVLVALCWAGKVEKAEADEAEEGNEGGALVKSFQMVDEPILNNEERVKLGTDEIARRALKAGSRAEEVNALPDASSGQNFPLRPFTITNLTDILAVEWTCNSSLGRSKPMEAKTGCHCVSQMVREGNNKNFEKCCESLWKWIQKLKKDKKKIKIIMLYQPEEAKQRSEKTGKKEPKEEFFEEYETKSTQCLKGETFGDLRTDKLAGMMLTPCRMLIAMLIIIFAGSTREYFTQ